MDINKMDETRKKNLEKLLESAKKDLSWKEPKPIKESTLQYLFERQDVSIEESGYKPYHYYTLDIGDICLITNASDEATEKGWYVSIFDSNTLNITTDNDLIELIDILQRNI